jgi:chromosome segregation ATPase
MSEQPLTRAVLASVLADFHRDVMRPDIKQIVGEEVGALRREMSTYFDAFYQRFEHLETEYQALKAGLGRIESRLEQIEGRLEQVEARLERVEMRLDQVEIGLDGVKRRLDHLEQQVLELRTRLGRVEERLEESIALEEKYPVRAEVQDLKARAELLHEDIRRLEQRLKA